MKRTLGISFALLLAASAALADLGGAWTATRSENDDARYHFSLQRGRHNQNGMGFDLSDFAGLSEAQVNATTQTPVHFELRREAGTIVFDGTFRNGNGAGEFNFTPNRSYENAVRALGVEFDLNGHDDVDEQLFTLAVIDVSTAYIRSMQSVGYRVSLEKYLNMRIFKVTPEYVREMASLGFDNLPVEKLVETKIFKVTPDYIREVRAAGKNPSLADMVQSRIFKITPEFAAEMAKEGYPDLSENRLVEFKIHKVTPEFIRDLRKLGYDHIPASKLVEMRIHRVTPEFIQELADAGYHNVPIDKMIQMRIFKIEPDMVKKLNDAAQ